MQPRTAKWAGPRASSSTAQRRAPRVALAAVVLYVVVRSYPLLRVPGQLPVIIIIEKQKSRFHSLHGARHCAHGRYRHTQQCCSVPSDRSSSVQKSSSGSPLSTRALTRLHTYCNQVCGRASSQCCMATDQTSMPGSQACAHRDSMHAGGIDTGPHRLRTLCGRRRCVGCTHLGQQARVRLAFLGLHALLQARLIHLHLQGPSRGSTAHSRRAWQEAACPLQIEHCLLATAAARKAGEVPKAGGAANVLPAVAPRQGLPAHSPAWRALLACGSLGSTGPSSSRTPRTAASCHASPGSSFSLSGRPRRRRAPLGSTCRGGQRGWGQGAASLLGASSAGSRGRRAGQARHFTGCARPDPCPLFAVFRDGWH